jgi:cytochrome c oxidase subunit 2
LMPQETENAREYHPVNLSTRRGFVAAISLGAVSLYGLWAGLGAAPLRFWVLGESTEEPKSTASGAHEGHGGSRGPEPDEFRRMTDEFNAAHRQADGSIAVEPIPTEQSMPGMDMPMADHSGHSMPGMEKRETDQHKQQTPLDVYMLAQQWSFDPALLRLKANQPYRFRMMAVDAAHGASIQLGKGSYIIRLPKGTLVEREVTFTQPGEYLLYCTMYCGEGHQVMSGKIVIS